jgi:hypothetical protein
MANRNTMLDILTDSILQCKSVALEEEEEEEEEEAAVIVKVV